VHLVFRRLSTSPEIDGEVRCCGSRAQATPPRHNSLAISRTARPWVCSVAILWAVSAALVDYGGRVMDPKEIKKRLELALSELEQRDSHLFENDLKLSDLGSISFLVSYRRGGVTILW